MRRRGGKREVVLVPEDGWPETLLTDEPQAQLEFPAPERAPEAAPPVAASSVIEHLRAVEAEPDEKDALEAAVIRERVVASLRPRSRR